MDKSFIGRKEELQMLQDIVSIQPLLGHKP